MTWLTEKHVNTDFMRKLGKWTSHRLMELESQVGAGKHEGSDDRAAHRKRISGAGPGNSGGDYEPEDSQTSIRQLGELMDVTEEEVLIFMSFPTGRCRQIASTNNLERLNKEIKRSANVVGIFPDDASVVRLIGTLAMEQWNGT